MINRRAYRIASVGYLLDSGYLWLARDLNGSIAAYSHKPFKLDDEVWRVEEGESKDVDATNGIVALGVNDVVELDRDNKIVTGGATVFKIDARNSGRSAILEKAKTLGGLLKNTNTESMNSQEKQLYCAGEKVNIGDQIFVAKENEVFTVADIMTDGTVVTTPNINGCTRYFRPELIRLLNASGTGDAIKSHSYEPPVPNHAKVCQELTETYKKKNADYGNSFENSLDKHGLIAGIIRMDDKMSRLISLNSKKEQQVLDESLRDTLMDLANYAIMSVMWLDNKSGEDCDGGSNYDIYADNQKLSGADYDGDTTNS